MNNKASDTKQLLLDISEKLFNEKGFDKVSIDEICSAAGVTKGAFYHHFNSKSDIPVQQYRATQGLFYRAYEKTSKLPVLERFKKAVLWYATYCTPDKINIFKNYYRVMILSPKNKVMRKIEMESKVFSELLSVGVSIGVFKSDINIDFYVEAITRFIFSLLLDWSIFNGNLNLHKELTYLYDNIVSLIIYKEEINES